MADSEWVTVRLRVSQLEMLATLTRHAAKRNKGVTALSYQLTQEWLERHLDEHRGKQEREAAK